MINPWNESSGFLTVWINCWFMRRKSLHLITFFVVELITFWSHMPGMWADWQQTSSFCQILLTKHLYQPSFIAPSFIWKLKHKEGSTHWGQLTVKCIYNTSQWLKAPTLQKEKKTPLMTFKKKEQRKKTAALQPMIARDKHKTGRINGQRLLANNVLGNDLKLFELE